MAVLVPSGRYSYRRNNGKQGAQTLKVGSSEPCEFFRVNNDADCLNQPLLHIHCQDEPGSTVSAANQGGLTVNFPSLERLEPLQQDQEGQ